MSTTIYENEDDTFLITQYGRGKHKGLGIQITKDGKYVQLSTEEVETAVEHLNVWLKDQYS